MSALSARIVLFLLMFSTGAAAAKLPTTFDGFVTTVVSASQFEIGSHLVTWEPKSTRIYQIEQGGEVDASAVMAIHIGSYVHIEGGFLKGTGEFLATAIGFLGPTAKEIGEVSGVGLIEEKAQLTSDNTGITGTVWVDGFPLRVTPRTKLLSVDGAAFPIGQIGTNLWAAFDATRRPDGSMETRSITFEPNTITSDELRYRDKSEPAIDLPDYARRIPGKIKFHLQWMLNILPDEAVQEYVTKVGESLIPEYQKDLPASDPAKVNFRFYVVERPSRWKEVLNDADASPGGVIYIPDSVLGVLDNEAQLAALLSNCIAVTLEKQLYVHRTRLRVEHDVALTGELAGLYGLPVSIPNTIEANRFLLQRNEQASRIGLRYMLREGYDIREAPLSWSAAANKAAENPQLNGSNPSSLARSVMGDLYFDYASVDYPGLKTNRVAYQKMLVELRAAAPKLPKPHNH